MAGYNIGPKIGIEGEAEFRRQISDINRSYKTLEAQTKAVAASFELHGDKQRALTEQSDILQKKLTQQRDKVKLLEDALKKARTQYSNSLQTAEKFRATLEATDASTPAEEIQRLKQELNKAEASIRKTASGITSMEGALYDTQATISGLEKELRDTDDELARLAKGIEDVGDEAEKAEGGVLTFGDALKAGIASGVILDAAEDVGEALLDIGREAVEAAAEVKAANSQFEQTFKELESTAEGALENVADETGVAVTRMQDAYTSMYAFTKNVEGESEQALDIARRAMIAAADSAAYYDRSMEDVTETLQSFLKGNYENDAALGIAATETTRNAKANELYAKSFQELSEAQKVDVLLAMVEAGNAASGALGQAAREADSWTNVLGEASEAWRQLMAVIGTPVMEGLIPLIQGVTSAMQGLIATTQADDLRSAMDDFDKALQSANESLAETRTATQANANLAGRYVSRLQALEKAGLGTAEAQEEYAATVSLLNELLPGLNLTIDEQTGLVEQSTAAISYNVEALRKQAMQQQLQQNFTALLNEQAAAEIALSDAKRRMIELEEQANVLRAQGADATRVSATSTQMLAGEMVTLNGVYSEQDAALAAVLAEMAHLQPQIKESEAAYADLSAEVDKAGAAVENFGDKQKSSVEANHSVRDSVVSIQQRLDELNGAYADAREAAAESIDAQIGLFEEMAESSDVSAEKILENWGKQQEAFANYSTNLQKAVDMGLDEALVAQLSDGSQQSMQILHEFVNGTELSVDEINAAFRGLSESKDAAADSMAGVKTACREAMEDIERDAYSSGVEIVNGVAQAVRNNTYLLENAMRNMGKKAQAAFNRTMEINSPSRVMAEAGDYTVDGLVNQIRRRTADLERTMEAMGDKGMTALERQLEAAQSFPVSYPAAVSSSTSNTYNRGATYITINAQDGQSAREIAREVADLLSIETEREEAAFG